MLPLDLHVLGTPPAFILSQDQTLHIKCSVFKHIDSNINLTLIESITNKLVTDSDLHY